jgi:DNA processing protein
MAGTSLQATRPRPELSLFEQKVLDAIGSGKIHVDDIAISARLSSGEVLVELLNLELKGLIRQQPGKIFSAI